MFQWRYGTCKNLTESDISVQRAVNTLFWQMRRTHFLVTNRATLGAP